MSRWPRHRFIILGFALLCFFLYRAALRRYYLFDGDHAIQIMMAKYFSWQSTDFYYWGQNRLGSLIPILLIVPIELLGLPALASAVGLSMAFYLAALGILAWLARTKVESAAALLGFFLVPIGCYRFLLYTGHPYGPAMALTLAAFAWLFCAPPSRVQSFFAGVILSVACWVSDASIAAVAALLALLFERRKTWHMDAAKFTALLAGTAVLLPFIFYWRERIGFVGHDGDYVKFATPAMLYEGLAKFVPQFSDLVNNLLPTKHALSWFGAGLLILVNPLVLVFRKRWVDEAPDNPRPPLLTFLALHNCLYFGIMWVSRHSYFGAGLIQRYWVPVVIFSLYELFVLTARAWQRLGWRSPAGLLGIASVVCVLGSIIPMVGAWPRGRGPQSAFSVAKEHRANLQLVRSRGATHVTGDYWHSLPLSVLSEFKVLAVPRDFSRTAQFAPEFSEEARRRNPTDYLDFPDPGHVH